MDNINFVELFLKGGFIMWPLLAISILSVVLILERSIFFWTRRYRVGRSLDDLKNGNGDSASTNNPLLSVGHTFLDNVGNGEEYCYNVTHREAERQINRHERQLRLLALIGAISPLIGLLGTVWGMVKAFAKIAELGDRVVPADFANGIWTGLLTTVAGLVVAIPAVAASRIFEAKVDQLAHDLNEVLSHLRQWKFGQS
jgi:biopolymer transport protein ExbB